MTVVAGLHEPRCTNDPCTCAEVTLLLAPADETLGFPKPTPRPPKEPTPLKSRPHVIPERVRFEVYKRDQYVCQWCKRPGGRLDPHHILPRGRGGKDIVENLVSLHRQCHDYVHTHPVEACAAGVLA